MKFWERPANKKYLFLIMSVWICAHNYGCLQSLETLDLPKLELQAVVSWWTWMLETELRASTRGVL